MANTRRKQKKAKALSSGRPPGVLKSKASLSAVATRTLIRSHHQLHKELHKATTSGDNIQAKALQEEIDALGGLESYQQASILGQSKDRGGDSSVVLMQWLESFKLTVDLADAKPRLLEVGALSTSNACSKSKLFDIERIDLNSQSDGILCQDFMQRPLTKQEDEKFDMISLSLVLNYVPDAVERGEMLKRTCQFLRRSSDDATRLNAYLPALFVVLPAPCITNSRYLDANHFNKIMEALGYRLSQRKQTAKLIYTLWHLFESVSPPALPKTQVNPGHPRNNFTIIFESSKS